MCGGLQAGRVGARPDHVADASTSEHGEKAHSDGPDIGQQFYCTSTFADCRRFHSTSVQGVA
jgi:hypothetical protein